MQIWLLMTSPVVQVHWRDPKLRISSAIRKQCYWNLAGMLHSTKYIRWYIPWCCYDNRLSSPFIFITKYYQVRPGILPWLVASRNIWFWRGKRQEQKDITKRKMSFYSTLKSLLNELIFDTTSGHMHLNYFQAFQCMGRLIDAATSCITIQLHP